MDVYFEALAEHADGVANAALRIDNEFMRKDVQDFAIFRKRDVARGVDGAAHVFALDVSRPLSKSDAAAAIYAAHVAAGHSDKRFLHGPVGNLFSAFICAADAPP